MNLCQATNQRQADTPAFTIGIKATLGLIISLKDISDFFFHDANARVGNFHLKE